MEAKIDPNATVVRLDNMPGVTAIPDLPNATVVRPFDVRRESLPR